MEPVVQAVLRLISDILAMLIVIIIMIVLQKTQPFQEGYFQNDESIQRPYKDSTIASYILYIVSVLLILINVITCELLIGKNKLTVKHRKIPVVLYLIYDMLIVAFFGYLVTIALTDVGKAFMGRLRPNFIDVCGPQVSETSTYGFIVKYTCSKASSKQESDARKSFPSGHSSIAIYSAVFLCVYLQLRLYRLQFVPSVRVALQIIYVALGLVVCYSRVLDNKHHWSDVLFGGLLGMLVALSTPFFLPYTPTLYGDSNDSRLINLLPIYGARDNQKSHNEFE